MKRTFSFLFRFLISMFSICSTAQAEKPNLEEFRAIAKAAYTYGFPMVDSYRIQYAYFENANNPEFKAPWNTLKNIPRVYTWEDTAIQTPNSDTPYSMAGLDLRSEPMVLTIPKTSKDRYFSVQLVDSYTFNFNYIGSRATGNDGGNFIVAGPNWNNKIPNGITKVIRSETEFAIAIYRTQVKDPLDLENVKAIQAGYKVQTLSSFLGQAAPVAAPAINFPQPLFPEKAKPSLKFYNNLNFLLRFCPTNASEAALMERFAKIGVGGHETFDVAKLSPDVKKSICYFYS